VRAPQGVFITFVGPQAHEDTVHDWLPTAPTP
jgi:hypothetical protein